MPNSDQFTIRGAAAGKLRRLLADADGARFRQIEPAGLGELGGPIATYVALTTSTISARVAATLGSGTATIFAAEDNATGGFDLATAAVDETVYNLTATAVPANAYVLLLREPLRGLLVVVQIVSSVGLQFEYRTECVDGYLMEMTSADGMHWTPAYALGCVPCGCPSGTGPSSCCPEPLCIHWPPPGFTCGGPFGAWEWTARYWCNEGPFPGAYVVDISYRNGGLAARYSHLGIDWDCTGELTLTLRGYDNSACPGTTFPPTLTITSGACPSGSGSGSTACANIILLGTASSGGATVPSLTLGAVTVDAGAELAIGVITTDGSVPSSATFNGHAMTQRASAQPTGTSYWLTVWQYANGGSPQTGDIVVTPSSVSAVMFSAREAEGIQGASAGGGATGTTAQPDTGAVLAANACDYWLAAFAIVGMSGTPTVNGPFADEGQTISMTVGGNLITLFTASVALACGGGCSEDAKLSGITQTSWAGLLQVWKP